MGEVGGLEDITPPPNAWFCNGSSWASQETGKICNGSAGHRGKPATLRFDKGFVSVKMITLGFDKHCAALYYSRRGFFSAKTDHSGI